MKKNLIFILTILVTMFVLFGVSKVNPSNFEMMKERTVLVKKTCGKKKSWGSGVIISGNKVLTAEHVIDDLEGCTISVSREHEEEHSAAVLKFDELHDLALLLVDHDFDLETKIATEVLGEDIIVFGYPRQYLNPKINFLSVLYGNVSTVELKYGDKERWMTRISATVNFGNSGGPVFDKHGRVIGIVVGMHRQHPGYYYAVRSKDILEFLR